MKKKNKHTNQVDSEVLVSASRTTGTHLASYSNSVMLCLRAGGRQHPVCVFCITYDSYPVVLANTKLAECNCFSSGDLVNLWSPHCQGCCGFRSPALVWEGAWHLCVAPPPPPPPAGQIVSLCGCGLVGRCWTPGCAGGKRSADIHLCSNVSGPPQTASVYR